MKKGFTLIELLVVVLILGILATISMPLYRKTVETSKATDALSILNMIANANRMYQLDNGSYSTGNILSTQVLVSNKYIANHPWASYQWKFCACSDTAGCGACGGASCSATGRIACAYNTSGLGAPFNTWRYEISPDGTCNAYGTQVPPCPQQ